MSQPATLMPVPDPVPVPTFETFFEDEHTRLFRALALMTANAAEAEELMQDAFLKVWERWDRVAAMENPAGYLYRSAMNLFRNRTRRLRLEALRRPFGSSAADGFALVEARDRVARALRSLSPRQRAALVLTDMLGYESAEAGELLKIKPATVRVLAHQAREAIRNRTENDDD
jgi:RNA polymerase sigma-70 factor (ECF subfamily)